MSGVLVRLPNWIGDAVLALPAIALLPQHGLQPVLVGKGWAGELLRGTGWPLHRYPASMAERVRLLRRLRPQTQPRALCLPNSISSAIELRLGGFAPVGYRKEGRRPLLADSLPLPGDTVHELQRHWQLACRLLDLQLPAPACSQLPLAEADRQAAAARLRAAGVHGDYLVVAPFAASDFAGGGKKWPQFPAFTAWAMQHFQRPVVVCPGPGEAAALTGQPPGLVVLADVDLGVYAAVLAAAALVVANDTGPGHIAAAVGAPLVSVLGPSRPEVHGSLGPRVTWVHDPVWPGLRQVCEAAEARWAGTGRGR